ILFIVIDISKYDKNDSANPDAIVDIGNVASLELLMTEKKGIAEKYYCCCLKRRYIRAGKLRPTLEVKCAPAVEQDAYTKCTVRGYQDSEIEGTAVRNLHRNWERRAVIGPAIIRVFHQLYTLTMLDYRVRRSSKISWLAFGTE
ncbi:hypothetical protein CLF_109365, partial [Clonorchis sinensis]